MSATPSEEEVYFVNGLNGSTGGYLEEALSPQEVGDAAMKLAALQPDEEKGVTSAKAWRLNEPDYGALVGIDLGNLEETGWGVLFTQDAPPEIRDALQPLLNYRHNQVGDLFKVYEGEEGYLPGESWEQFRIRHHISKGQADPQEMPYYLLIVGDPETIPYDFQYLVDVERAVGRIHFDRLDDYARYAQSVVSAGDRPLELPRRVTFFGTSNPDDGATRQSSEDLIGPLAEKLNETQGKQNWQMNTIQPQDATKTKLRQLLGGPETPALLFTATHGVAWNCDDPYYPRHQGALVTQEWPGPKEWRARLKEDFFFSGTDISDEAKIWGLIAVFFACFGAGTPRDSDFYHLKEYRPAERLRLANRALLAPLPMRLLSHPRGGALAVVGHVERAWTTSFKNPGPPGPDNRDLQAFEQLLSLLLRGYPIGAALEDMNSRFAQFSTDLSNQLYPVLHQGMIYTDECKQSVARLWTGNNDARNYIIVGDPAARLPISDTATAEMERPSMSTPEITIPPAQATPPQARPAAMPPPAEPETGRIEGKADAESLWITQPPPGLSADPELLAAWREHVKAGYRHNDEMFHRILKAFLHPYYTTVWMNGILFAVGILAFLSGLILSIRFNQPLYALTFAGLSAVAFLSYFFSRPLRSLEENLEFITWLGTIYNSYWTRLVCANDPATVQQEIQIATKDMIAEIEHLIQKHAALSRRRPQAQT